MSITRRQFMVGCSAAIAGMAGGRISQLVFAEQPTAMNHTTYLPVVRTSPEIFIMIFLRGGCDGLSLVTPFDDARYVQARGNLAVPDPSSKKANAALKISPNNAAFGATSSFGLHPSAAPLKELYDAGKLAIVHGCGLDDDTRSHFDAMDYIERGTPGDKSTSSGWLARHLTIAGGLAGLMPVVAAGAATPASLLTDNAAVAMSDINSYSLRGPYGYASATNPAMFNSLQRFYHGSGQFQEAGQRAIEVMRAIQAMKVANGGKDLTYTPSASASYPDTGLSDSLQLLAQLIKLDLGLQIATVDYGGWDTHDNQGTNGGYYASRVDDLTRNLLAFYNDLPAHRDHVTIVVMSEFGRRLGANTGGGTDHGHGNVMFVLGGQVNGGKMYGKWPGLQDLDQKQDLRITTDFRSVLGEVVAQRLNNVQLGAVFPGLTSSAYHRLGIIPGANKQIDFSTI